MSLDALIGATERLLAVHGPTLVRVAARSIEHGLAFEAPLRVRVEDFDPALAEPGACFVTLRLRAARADEDDLRGCIGSVAARRPLIEDVAHNAFGAAFRDPRFDPLRADELDRLDLSLSVLSPLVPLPFVNEADLIAKIRPGVDGVMIGDAHHQGLFLPSVWAQLPAARDFVRHLKRKAGLSFEASLEGFHAERFVTAHVDAGCLPSGEPLWRTG